MADNMIAKILPRHFTQLRPSMFQNPWFFKINPGWAYSSSQKEKRQFNIYVRVLRYAFGIRDSTAMAVPAQTIARPDMELDVQR
ncbi:hypothetical protein A0256_00780 [Mucilaginibacter sp. PAMC 26640]|nr:hypothetical protein A0256_00780 [Mucilaginibacter sp. PAMC 26640]